MMFFFEPQQLALIPTTFPSLLCGCQDRPWEGASLDKFGETWAPEAAALR